MALDPSESRRLAVRFDAVVKTYRGETSIGPVSFAIEAGSCFGLVGANGAGKSTLMRCLLGLDSPTSGTIELFGEPVRPSEPPRQTSGLIEEPKFFDWLGARENMYAVFGRQREASSIIEQVLNEVGLGQVGKRPVRAFSQGMRQRLGLARVLAAQPDLLVLDEPTNGLDPEGIRWLRKLIRDLVSSGKTVLLSSHLLHEIQAVADAFLMIDQGTVIASGSVPEISNYASLEDLYFGSIAR